MGYEFESLSGKIIEAAIEVHRDLGPGFLESIYENAMKVALSHCGHRVQFQHPVTISFEGEEVGTHRLDLIVEDQIVVELKAIKAFEDIHFAQVKSYLKATRLPVGLLFNFNSTKLAIKRVVLSDQKATEPNSPLVSDAT
jgi:GxxExxY protein